MEFIWVVLLWISTPLIVSRWRQTGRYVRIGLLSLVRDTKYRHFCKYKKCYCENFNTFSPIFIFKVRNPWLTFLLSYHVWVILKVQVNFRFRRYLEVLMNVSYELSQFLAPWRPVILVQMFNLLVQDIRSFEWSNIEEWTVWSEESTAFRSGTRTSNLPQKNRFPGNGKGERFENSSNNLEWSYVKPKRCRKLLFSYQPVHSFHCSLFSVLALMLVNVQAH